MKKLLKFLSFFFIAGMAFAEPYLQHGTLHNPDGSWDISSVTTSAISGINIHALNAGVTFQGTNFSFKDGNGSTFDIGGSGFNLAITIVDGQISLQDGANSFFYSDGAGNLQTLANGGNWLGGNSSASLLFTPDGGMTMQGNGVQLSWDGNGFPQFNSPVSMSIFANQDMSITSGGILNLQNSVSIDGSGTLTSYGSQVIQYAGDGYITGGPGFSTGMEFQDFGSGSSFSGWFGGPDQNNRISLNGDGSLNVSPYPGTFVNYDGPINMTGNAVTNMAEPIGPQNAATKHYVDTAAFDNSADWVQAGGILSPTSPTTISAENFQIIQLLDPTDPQMADTQAARDAAISVTSFSAFVTYSGATAGVTDIQDSRIVTSTAISVMPDSSGVNLSLVTGTCYAGSVTLTATNPLETGIIHVTFNNQR